MVTTAMRAKDRFGGTDRVVCTSSAPRDWPRDRDVAKILLADDDQTLLRLVGRALAPLGHEVVGAPDGMAALRQVEADPPDLIIVDVHMPRMDGWGLLSKLKESPRPEVAHVPVVMLTVEDDHRARIRAGIEGALYYLSKPVDVTLLRSTVVAALQAGSEGEPARRRQIQRQALIALARLERLKRSSGPPGQRPGTTPGRTSDALAGALARLTSRHQAVLDAVAASDRLGDAAAALAVSRSTLSAYLRSITQRLGLSSTDDLVRLARQGALASASGPSAAALVSELGSALHSDQLALVYQPMVQLADGVTVAHEALLRWHHPVHGVVMPATFVGETERAGPIHQMGTWVLNKACEQLGAWSQGSDLDPPRSVAVNLSARQLEAPGFVEVVERAIAAGGFDPCRLVLELTETALMQEPAEGIAVLRRIRDLGVGLSADDFGTGYSSLAYLRDLRLDYLKIDRSFVVAADTDSRSSTIIRCVVELGHALDCKVVAEGVETPGQAEHLRAMGCDLAQGYFYGRPVPPQDVSWLAR